MENIKRVAVAPKETENWTGKESAGRRSISRSDCNEHYSGKKQRQQRLKTLFAQALPLLLHQLLTNGSTARANTTRSSAAVSMISLYSSTVMPGVDSTASTISSLAS